MSIKLYTLEFSPFSKGVLTLIKENNLDIPIEGVDLFAGDHLKGSFAEVSKYNTIPCLVDGDLTLNQGVTILKYLATKYNCPEYPQDLNTKIKIVEAIDWLITDYKIFVNFLGTGLGIIPWVGFTDQNIISSILTQTKFKRKRCLDILDKKLADNEYMCGSDVTIADYHGWGIVSFSFISPDFSLEKHPNIDRWIKKYPDFKEYTENVLPGLRETMLDANKNKAIPFVYG